MSSNQIGAIVVGVFCLAAGSCAAFALDAVRPVKGAIHIEGERFVDDNGPIQLVGYSDYNEFSGKGEAYQPPPGYIETLARNGVNLARVFIDFTHEAGTYWSSIQTIEVNGPHAKLTEEFKQRLRQGLEAAQEHGVVVILVLFDGCCYVGSNYTDTSQGHSHWFVHTNDGAKSNFDIINSPNLMAAQIEYINEVLSISTAYPNVLYELANELGNGHSSFTPDAVAWTLVMGNVIRARTPAPISISMNRHVFGTAPELLPVIDYTGEHGSCRDHINLNFDPVDPKVRGIDWGRPIIWDDDGCWGGKGRDDPVRVKKWVLNGLRTGHSFNHKGPTPNFDATLGALTEAIRIYNEHPVIKMEP